MLLISGVYSFHLFPPTVRSKSASSEKEVTASTIVQRKIRFYPDKIFKGTLNGMSITKCVELDTDYTNGSGNGGQKPKPDEGGDVGNGEAPDPIL